MGGGEYPKHRSLHIVANVSDLSLGDGKLPSNDPEYGCSKRRGVFMFSKICLDPRRDTVGLL